MLTFGHITRPLAQVVQMPHRELRQAFVTGIAMDLDGALQQGAGGRPRQGVVQGIGLGEQGHILGRVGRGKAGRGRSVQLFELALGDGWSLGLFLLVGCFHDYI
jgi:hypothetical protein